MAKIKNYIGELSGKLGGYIFARNKGGSYVRAFATPTNPRTIAQIRARGIFSSAVTGWHALTDATKQLWNQAAATFFKSKHPVAGTSLSGFNAYVSAKANLESANQKNVVLTFNGITATTQPLETDIFNPPAAAMGGNIGIAGLGPTGETVPTSITLADGAIDTINGLFQFSLQLGQAYSVANLPVFSSPVTSENMGVIFSMSMPGTQEQQFTKSPKYNTFACTGLINITAVTGPSNDIEGSFSYNTDNLKFQATHGQIVEINAFLIGESGQTYPIGAIRIGSEELS